MKQPGTISAPFRHSVKDINNISLTHLFSLFENDICTSYDSIECQCVIHSVCHRLMYQGFLVNIWTPHIHQKVLIHQTITRMTNVPIIPICHDNC